VSLDVFVFFRASPLAFILRLDLHVNVMLLKFICSYVLIYKSDLFNWAIIRATFHNISMLLS